MKYIYEVNGRTNEKLSEIKALNVEEIRRNNRYSEFAVATKQSGSKLVMTLEPIHINLLSHKQLQWVQSLF
jgi:hypothetical protein